ncbi:alpha/beta fold hydrolase [Leptobacterium flavescens]|uniref:Proline iminopeptidase n=1 Tax=Leptobacterium flavescens TaxID=472055 RepID=A0A6P0UN08_9FLAO|nr:alpha/beta hydrolase [Leptobacterium flavescens]NER14407.1 alpha/beta fold hydrolase [Leptobacterium flavescens]
MKKLLLIGLLLLIYSCNKAEKIASAEASLSRLADYTDTEYGFLEVPESRESNSDKKIKLAYIVLKAKSENPKPDPIVYLQGGPGGSTLFMAAFWENHPLRNDRDIVLMDQRGTGLSNAVCADMGNELIDVLSMDLNSKEEYEEVKKRLKKCRQEISEKDFDLSAYNSRENAADFEDLRKELGYRQWNLFGGSYGTRLGLTYMRDFPEKVRSSVLFGVFAPESDLYSNFISNFNASLSKTFEACENDPDCNEKYPDLKKRFFETVNALDKKAVVFEYQGKDFHLNSQDMLLLTHQLLYSRSTIGLVPAFVEAVNSGDERTLTQALQRTVATTNLINFAMYLSVNAYEELPFNGARDLEEDLKNNPDFITGPSYFNYDAKILEKWHPHRAGDIENAPVISDIPTLFANGRFDPVTPTSNARQAAKSVKNSFFVEFPTDSHSLFNPCFFRICREFLDNPATSPDLSCASQSFSIPWF